jgi:hypothetical protein
MKPLIPICTSFLPTLNWDLCKSRAGSPTIKIYKLREVLDTLDTFESIYIDTPPVLEFLQPFSFDRRLSLPDSF